MWGAVGWSIPWQDELLTSVKPNHNRLPGLTDWQNSLSPLAWAAFPSSSATLNLTERFVNFRKGINFSKVKWSGGWAYSEKWFRAKNMINMIWLTAKDYTCSWRLSQLLPSSSFSSSSFCFPVVLKVKRLYRLCPVGCGLYGFYSALSELGGEGGGRREG